MAALKETVDTVESIDVDAYKYGFSTISNRTRPEGPFRRHRSLHLGQEGRAAMAHRLAAVGLSALADHDRAQLGASRTSRIDYQDLYYYSAPKSTPGPTSLEDVDPELLRTYEKLGIPLREQEILAGVEVRRSRSTRCSTASPSRRPSRKSWRGPA